MFKMAEFATEVEKQENIAKVQSALEGLPADIEVIRSFHVGLNVVNSHSAFDLVLVSEFDSVQHLEEYRVHPAHVEVVKLIRQLTSNRAAVDYEI